MKRLLTIQLEIDDQDLDRDVPFDIWLFQFLNRLGYNFKVKSFTVDGVNKVLKQNDDLKDMHGDIKKLTTKEK